MQKKSAVKHSAEKPFLHDFVNLYRILSKVVLEKKFPTIFDMEMIKNNNVMIHYINDATMQ